jgi:hypothetical protein
MWFLNDAVRSSASNVGTINNYLDKTRKKMVVGRGTVWSGFSDICLDILRETSDRIPGLSAEIETREL